MQIIDYIEELCNRANAAYVFMHEEADMINVKVDALQRGDKFVYVEALRSGAYTRNRYGIRYKTYDVRIFFSQFTGFANDMRATVLSGGRVTSQEQKNETVLRSIETEIVQPFLQLLDTPDVQRAILAGQPWQRVAFQYPPSRYDGNELSVMIQFTASVLEC